MSDKERMQELVDVYCDADMRGRINSDEMSRYSPTISDVLEVMGGAQ